MQHPRASSAEAPSDSELHRFLRAAVEAADVLAKLHQSGIIHQNIRPQTFRIDPGGEGVELSGADLGRHEAPPMSQLPKEALPYIAPEQTGRLEGDIDQRTDLYALGVMLYELRAGALPFHADDAVGWVHCHVARAPRSLSDGAPGTPAIVSDIVMKLLAKSPDDRYQSARGLTHDLRRCLSELSSHGRVHPFPLGARDVWDKLRASSRMYGRREELAALRVSLDRVRSSGQSEVCLVSGPSGIGKSALVGELRRGAGGASAAFLTGKFEENKRDIPYATLGQAFQDLIRQTVAKADEELAAVREQLAAALGDSGQLIIDLIPQVELIVGKQPPAPPLGAADARNRFHLVFRSFLGVFTARERPLVVFLDDLQWADCASLELLSHLLTHPETRNLLVVGAYRSDEVSASPPLEAALAEIRGAGVPVTTLALGPLAQRDFVDLVVDLFRCERDDAKPLAAVLWTKAAGNPFFAVQLLGALYQDQLIHFDPRRWAWVWDITAIEAQEITSDMVELVLGKLRRLPEATLDALKLAAFIGTELSVELLGTLSGEAPEEVQRALEPAVMDGLLLQRQGGYKFLHDRVLEAAYSLTPEDERPGLHLRLGWLLLEASPEGAEEGLLFHIVNQLNLGLARVELEGDKIRIAELDLRAGQKAKAASAVKSAASYLATGASLLPEGAWEARYELAFGLHIELAECAFLSGRFDEAARLCAILAARSRGPVDRAAVYRLEIEMATAQVQNARAVELGRACLSALGVELPESPTKDDFLAEVARAREEMKGLRAPELIGLPSASDPAKIAAMEILSVIYPPAAYVLPSLAHVAIARIVRLSVQHGNAPASVFGYVNLGHILCSRLGAFAEGYRFGKLAWDLAQRPGLGRYKSAAAIVSGTGIVIWSRPAREAVDLLQTGFRLARGSGALMYGATGLLQLLMTLFFVGEPLDAAYEMSVSAYEFASTSKYAFLVQNIIACQRFIHSLRGDTERLGSLGVDEQSEEAFEADLRERNIPLVRYGYFVAKLTARALSGDYEGARGALKEADELIWSGVYCTAEVEHCFYAALTSAALCDGAAGDDRARLRERLSSCEAQLRQWAESSPENFSSRRALVAAELARVDGRDGDAVTLYDQAIRESRGAGFVQIEAVACELAGRFFKARSFAVLPAAYMKEARASYARWGALGKARQLEALYPELLAEPRRESAPAASADGEPIDTLTAAKASAAISSEVAPDELLATLMRILSEHAGAQRAALLLPAPEGLSVAAEITSDPDGVRVDIPKGKRAPSPAALPLSVAHYVRRSREKLILDDIAAETMFASDPYLAASRPKSILCAPILRRGEVAGVLYLENKLARGAFTPRRLALLEFLSAISLENALLAADLARETATRAQAEEIIEEQQAAIQRLSTPIIQVWDGVLTMPVLGAVDERRAEQMMSVLLSEVARTRSRYSIIDLTGVDAVDTRTADHIMRIVRAVELLGARSIVVGIRSEVAQTIVSMGVDLSSIVTRANLRDALVLCMRDQSRRARSARL